MRNHILLLVFAFGAFGQSRSLPLKAALELADAQSPTIAISRLETLEAKTQVALSRSALGPQIQGVAQGAYQTSNLQGVGLIFPGFPSRVGPYRTFNLRPQATMTILDLSLLENLRATRGAVEQKRWDEETAREGIRLAVVQLYLQLYEARSRAKAADVRIQSAEALLRQTQIRESAGGASKLDVSRNEQQLHAERYLKTLAERDERTIETILKEALGLTQNETLELSVPVLVEASNTTPDRAELKSLGAQLQSQQYLLRSAKQERLPKLDAYGDYGLNGQGPDKSLSTYQIGATLRIPLYTSGRIEAGIRTAQLRLDKTRELQRQMTLKIDREVAEAERELEAARKASEILNQQVKAAQETLELTRLRLESGLATSTDTTTAQAIVAEAQEQEIRTRYSAQIAMAKLARARGSVLLAVQ